MMCSGPDIPAGTIKFVGHPPSVVIGEDAKWTLPPADQIAAMSCKDLRKRIHDYIEHAERGDAQNRLGGMALAITRAQYLTEELARRNQDGQTKVMTEHTKTVKDYTVMIGIMTILVTLVSFVSMVVTVWAVVHPH